MLTELLHQRRSVRRYLDKVPPKAFLKDVVRCGQSAPSPSNSQPVRVRHIASIDTRTALKKALMNERDVLLENLAADNGPKRVRNYIRVYYRFSEFMFTAPWLLLVGTTQVSPGFKDHMVIAGLRTNDNDPQTDQDITVGLFVSAMLLRATELGLASCVLTAPLVFLAERNDLSVFNGITPKCFVTLGYGAETPLSPLRLGLDQIMETC
ncbi:MAG: nitroreductase family protein [Desulfobacteraceae bacterium]|jgi:nitroreductase